ncbi:MAG: glycosyl hydrolase 53 family protein [Sphingobacteriales bacterium]|nr:glycosyl hydrolase 53 family protein [Sphingobacteriales bacterium]MBI3720017.1 glycosyl hydrolase 53 family protein [Sphingobacteriales bacterium]
MRIIYSAFISLCLLCCITFFGCKKKSSTPTPPPPPDTTSSSFVKGADVSWVTEMESSGIKFYNSAGTATECMALLKSLGLNSIRLRVWVNPSAGWNNAADVVAKAVRAKNLGMRVMIDFHYSDDWADPGKQTKPTAWSALDFTGLKTALANHTTDVLNQLKSAGVTPEWVQVGNETNDGMLWPDGKASTNMNNFAQLINTGYDAVKSVIPSAKVIVHISNGWDNSLFRWIFDGLNSNAAKYDVIGMSLYPSYVSGGWSTANAQCLQNMNDMVSRYGKEVMIVEVGMPWDNAAESKNFLTDIIAKAKTVTNKKCLGVLYWEPECYNNWKGHTLGAFDNSGKPTVAMDAFK